MSTIGNGGAGPHYGVFPLGMHDDGRGLTSWDKGGLIGKLGKPFPHSHSWNLPNEFWALEPDPGEGIPIEEEDKLWEAWDGLLEKNYWAPEIMQGAIPICHEGCAKRNWLVVTGPAAGTVWRDARVEHEGISPIAGADGRHLSFTEWYLTWLDSSIKQAAP